MNIYHDRSNGQFTTADGVASGEAPATTLVASTSADQAQASGRKASAMAIVHETPDDAVSITAGDGTTFVAPPYANFQKVFGAGQDNWQNPLAVLHYIWQNGVYDFQRENGVFYSAYTDASNYAVGVYAAGAGYSYNATMAIGRFVANLISSNARANTQSSWWSRGWSDATNRTGPFARRSDH